MWQDPASSPDKASKKRKCRRKLPTRAFSFQQRHCVFQKNVIWREQLLNGEKKENNNRNFLKCCHQNAIFWRGLFFLWTHILAGLPSLCFSIIMQWFVVFSLSAILRPVPPVRRITSRLTMEISLHAFIVQFNPPPFVSLCLFDVCPINLPIYWKDNYLFPSKRPRLRLTRLVSSDQQRLW